MKECVDTSKREIASRASTAATKRALRLVGYVLMLVSLPSVIIVTLCDSLWNKLSTIGPVAGLMFILLGITYGDENKYMRHVG